jgi:hypothetical protein
MPRLAVKGSSSARAFGFTSNAVRPPLGLFIAYNLNKFSGPYDPFWSNDTGATWTQMTNPRTAGTITSTIIEPLNLGNGKIFALTSDLDSSFGVFDQGTTGYLTSTNGTTWTNAGTFGRSEIPPGQTRWNNYYSAAHNNRGTIVIMGTQAASAGGSSYCKVSTDYGVNWTTVNFGSGTKYVLIDLNGLQYVNNQFVALCLNGNTGVDIRFLTSPNGITWTVVTPSLGNTTSNYPLQVWAYDPINNRYVATRPANNGDDQGSDKAAYSTNLTTWTDTTLTQYYNPWVTYGAGKFVVQGYQTFYGEDYSSGTPYSQVQGWRDVEYSTNGGTSWQGTGRTVPGSVLPTGPGSGGLGQTGSYQKIEFAGGFFWAFGAALSLSGNDVTRVAPTWLARSTDALTWTKLNGPSTTGLFDAQIKYI